MSINFIIVSYANITCVFWNNFWFYWIQNIFQDKVLTFPSGILIKTFHIYSTIISSYHHHIFIMATINFSRNFNTKSEKVHIGTGAWRQPVNFSYSRDATQYIIIRYYFRGEIRVPRVKYINLIPARRLFDSIMCSSCVIYYYIRSFRTARVYDPELLLFDRFALNSSVITYGDVNSNVSTRLIPLFTYGMSY